jgi:hypothetical protein
MASGYAAAAVTHTMHSTNRTFDGIGGRLASLNDAGGQFMTRQDVANAGRKWKALNPDPRFKNG